MPFAFPSLARSLGLAMLCALFPALPLPADEPSAQTRIAILGDLERNRAESDCLTATLSKEPGVDLVERSEIDRIVAEQKLSALGMDTGDAIKAGALLGAKGLIVIKSFTWEGKEVLSARLVATDSGAILGAWIQDTPSEEANHFADAVRFKFSPLFQKLKVDRKELLAISLLSVRSPVDSPEMKELERKITLLLSQRLILEKSLVVLERWRLGNAAWEKTLNLDSNQLWTGAYVLDGTLERPDAQGAVKVTLRLLPPKGIPQTIETSGDPGDLKALAESLVEGIKAKLKPLEGWQGKAPAWNMSKEADFYLKEAEWLLRAGSYERAREAADASSALGMKGVAITFTHVKSFLGELGYAKIEERQSVIKARIENRRDRAGMVKDNPMLSQTNADKLIQALDIYVKFVDAGPSSLPGSFSEESDWRMLGERLLTASSDLLRAINDAKLHVSDPQWAEKAKLIRLLARKAAALTIEKGDDSYTIGAFYNTYLRTAQEAIFETQADFEAETRRMLAREFPLQPEMRYEIRHCLCAFHRMNRMEWGEERAIDGKAPKMAGWRLDAFDGLIASLSASTSQRDRIDALILKGRRARSDEIAAVLWAGRDELLEGRGRTGDCLAAFIFPSYEYTKISCKELLLYAFSQSKLYDGGIIRMMISTLASAKRPLNIADADCRKVAEGWYSYFARMKEADAEESWFRDFNNASVEESGRLNMAKTSIEKELAKISDFQPAIGGQGNPSVVQPELAVSMDGFLPGKDVPWFSLERISLRNGSLQVGGRQSKQGGKELAYLLSIDTKSSNSVFDSAPSATRAQTRSMAPSGLMLRDGSDAFFANHEGTVYATGADGQWRKLADTGFSMASAMTAANGKLYIGYGHRSSINDVNMNAIPSGIVQVDMKSGEQRIIASSRRNPALNPLDNRKPWWPDVMTCSDNGILMVRALLSVDTHLIGVFLIDTATEGGKMEISDDNHNMLPIWGGDLVFRGRRGYVFSVFDTKTGKLQDSSLGVLEAPSEYYDQATLDYKESDSFTMFAEYAGRALKMTQLDSNIFIMKILKLDDRKLYVTKFSLDRTAFDAKDRFLRGMELSSDRIFITLGNSKLEAQTSACVLGLGLSQFLKPEAETAAKKENAPRAAKTLEAAMPLSADPMEPGLLCNLYKGAWRTLPDMSFMTATSSQKAKAFESPGLDWIEGAAFSFHGYFKAETEGEYKFLLSRSPAAFALHVDEEPACFKPCPVRHGSGFVFFNAILKPGYHKIRLDLMTDTPRKPMIVTVGLPGKDGNYRSVEGLVFQKPDGK